MVGRRPQHAVSKITLSCAVLCHIVSPQYLSRSSLHRLAGFPSRLFLSYGLQVVTRDVYRASLRRLMCPAQDNLIFLTLFLQSDYVELRQTDWECNCFYQLSSLLSSQDLFTIFIVTPTVPLCFAFCSHVVLFIVTMSSLSLLPWYLIHASSICSYPVFTVHLIMSEPHHCYYLNNVSLTHYNYCYDTSTLLQQV